MMCWYCHWGWPLPIADIYDRYRPIAGESAMHYGPAHVVWDDENFGREHIEWCLEHFADYSTDNHRPDELAAVKASLMDMLALPDDILEPTEANRCEAEDGNPKDYPPSFPVRKC